MKVIVCGAGQVGSNIASHLAGLENDVTVIDRSSSLIRQISDRLDVRGIVGHASDPSVLQKAGAEDADLLVAVTWSDEVNMIACQVAYSLFQVPTKIARIRNQSYLTDKWSDLFSRGNLPVDVVISPELEIAKSLERRLKVPGTFNMIPFVDSRVRVLGLKIGADCPVVNTPLRQLSELFPSLMTTVIGIVRGDRVFVPRSADQIQVGDSVYIAVQSCMTDRAMAVFGHEEQAARRIVIVGGGNVGTFLAERLMKQTPAPNIKIIERDEERAMKLSEHVDGTVVIRGDALNREILLEANISEADTIVSVSDDDEVNILAALLARKEGCAHAVTLLNNSVYTSLIDELGIESALDPRETTASSIVRHIRRGRIRELYSIRQGSAEVIEAEVIAGSVVAGQTIRSLKLQGNIRFGLIVRGDEILVPQSETIFQAEDRVVMLGVGNAVKTIEQLFAARADVF